MSEGIVSRDLVKRLQSEFYSNVDENAIMKPLHEFFDRLGGGEDVAVLDINIYVSIDGHECIVRISADNGREMYFRISRAEDIAWYMDKVLGKRPSHKGWIYTLIADRDIRDMKWKNLEDN